MGDITRLGTFSGDATPPWLAGLDLMHSAVAGKMFVVRDGSPLVVTPEQATENGRAKRLASDPASRSLLRECLSMDPVPLLPPDPYPVLPPGSAGTSEDARMLSLGPSTVTPADREAARTTAASWGAYVLGTGAFADGDAAAAARHFAVAYERDPLNLRALNYYLMAKGRVPASVHAARLPLEIEPPPAGTTPASEVLAEFMATDLEAVPVVTSSWRAVTFAVNAVAVLMYATLTVWSMLD